MYSIAYNDVELKIYFKYNIVLRKRIFVINHIKNSLSCLEKRFEFEEDEFLRCTRPNSLQNHRVISTYSDKLSVDLGSPEVSEFFPDEFYITVRYFIRYSRNVETTKRKYSFENEFDLCCLQVT